MKLLDILNSPDRISDVVDQITPADRLLLGRQVAAYRYALWQFVSSRSARALKRQNAQTLRALANMKAACNELEPAVTSRKST
ncbi:MAG: hypothetical protein HYX76_08450 [Acidobacteria bacterium]|nr:hypothetical protein [Acidobacteriota bacterium]